MQGPVRFAVSPFDRGEQARLVRFIVVGASNTALTLSLYAIAVELGVWYPLAAFLGYAAGIVNGYTWNRIWTFRAGSFHFREFSRYLLVQGGGLVANVLGVVLAVETLGMGKVTAQIVTLVSIVLVTYSINRWWTFRPRETSALDS